MKALSDLGVVGIFEDEELLVVNKPAGLVCHPSKNGPLSSLVGRIRLYLGESHPAHLVNRLDRETSGVVVIAKNPSVAGELGSIWEGRRVQKRYQAITRGWIPTDHGTIDAPLGKDEQSIVAIKDCVRADGAAAVTEFSVLRRFRRDEGEFTLAQIRPRSGRKHQIRIHLSHLGHPLVGDKIYGGDERLYLAFVESRLTDRERAQLLLENHALHADSLAWEWRKERREYFAEPETAFRQFAESGETAR